jgi:hypothetical protein
MAPVSVSALIPSCAARHPRAPYEHAATLGAAFVPRPSLGKSAPNAADAALRTGGSLRLSPVGLEPM